ncbi:Eukaryotic translation initiation factor 4H [Hondaea fermentalgiana]|uniref:Eukaryotic translation initiation factor 4H n=1 Tax=Hondaea fermentalgiana TaxID=2315210 RepID=A0A2R5GA22_9STRA|nr:Eukaryotic translation initiation factor 4H [Hondaea fermentalgiana]|eukprot:GBG26578.1 Eukaryotic translation initiation factor 4H [Hondaea fermentalgiana]
MAQPDGKRPRRQPSKRGDAPKDAAASAGKAAAAAAAAAAATAGAASKSSKKVEVTQLKAKKPKTKEELEAKPRFERRKANKRPRDADGTETAAAPAVDVAASGEPVEKKVKKRRWKDKLASTLFVNQLPYDITDLKIRKFFCSVAGVSWKNILSVQMVSGPNGRFKGIAFVEMDSQEVCKTALKLDKAAMWGRQINVRLAESKQEVSTAREERIKEAREQRRTARDVASAETKHAKREFSNLAKTAPYLLKDGKTQAGTEDIDVLIERATMPRREKKQKVKSNRRGANPPKPRMQQRSTWKDFNEKSRAAMKKLPVIELKRRLNAFYKMDVDSMRDKNVAFLEFLQTKL